MSWFENLSWPRGFRRPRGGNWANRLILKGHFNLAEFGREWLIDCFRREWRELFAHLLRDSADLSIERHDASLDLPARQQHIFAKDILLRG
jgi:hypothetical protein